MNGLIAEILALTAGFNFLLLVSVMPFVKDQCQKPPIFMWLSSVGLYVISGLFLGALYFFAPYQFTSANSLAVLGFLFLVVSYSGAICFFFYLSTDIGWKKIWQVVFVILIVNIILMFIALRLPAELRSIAPSFWSIIIPAWFLYKISSSKYPQGEYLVYALKILAIATLLPALVWILLALNFHYSIIPFLPKERLIDLGDAIRIIRNLSAPISFFIMFIYWMKYDSIFARKAKEDEVKVQELLREKDSLIYELSKANSFASAGAFAGGLAHELNQYLARIQINADHAFTQALNNPSYEIFKNPLKRILDANKDAAGMIGALRATFSVREDTHLKMEIAEAIKDVANLYRGRMMHSKIEIRLSIPSQIGVIDWGGQLSIVLSNLLLNAIEALDESSQSKKIVAIKCEYVKEFILIKIFDNGSQIHPSKVSSIFMLFSSTKKDGIGVGLWLSKFIMQKNDGDLSFQNIDEDGIEFILKISRKRLLDKLAPGIG